jgi:hypothetical protein
MYRLHLSYANLLHHALLESLDDKFLLLYAKFDCIMGSNNLTNFLPQAVSAHSFRNFKMLSLAQKWSYLQTANCIGIVLKCTSTL